MAAGNALDNNAFFCRPLAILARIRISKDFNWQCLFAWRSLSKAEANKMKHKIMSSFLSDNLLGWSPGAAHRPSPDLGISDSQLSLFLSPSRDCNPMDPSLPRCSNSRMDIQPFQALSFRPELEREVQRHYLCPRTISEVALNFLPIDRKAQGCKLAIFRSMRCDTKYGLGRHAF